MIKTVINNNVIDSDNENYNISSWITNSSCILKLEKLQDLFKKVLSKEDSEKCIKWLNEYINMISNFQKILIWEESSIDSDILHAYASYYYGSKELAEQFISNINNKDLWKYFSVKYLGNKRIKQQDGYTKPKSIVFDFDFNTYIALEGSVFNAYICENTSRHYFMLLYILWTIRNAGVNLPDISNANNIAFYDSFLSCIEDTINSTVLTGLEAFAEYDLGFPYVLLFDELKQLSASNRRNLVISAVPENMSVTFSIKEYSMITKLFAKYLANAWTDSDIGMIVKDNTSKKGIYRVTSKDVININADSELDRATFSELRMVEGSEPNHMKVFITLSGQRIINRVLSINGNVKTNVKAHRMHEYIYLTDDMIAFLMWAFLHSTHESRNDFSTIQQSELLPYIQFTNEYIEEKSNEIEERGSKGKPRDIVPNTATIILLSKLSNKEQESFLNTHFADTDTQQKTNIRHGIARINELKRVSNSAPIIKRFLNEVKHVYKW